MVPVNTAVIYVVVQMGKVSEQARKKYQERIKEYKAKTNVVIQDEKKLALSLKKGDLESNPKRLILAEYNLTLVSYYTLLSSLSISLLGIRNDTFLNEARKCCYKAIIYIEEVVSDYVDVPFSEYEDRVLSIEECSDESIYELLTLIFMVRINP